MNHRMAILATAALLSAAGMLPAQDDGRPALVTLAILPFENLTGNTDDSWLSRGFAEELTAALSGVPSVRVVERNQLDRVLREQDFQLSDVSDPSNGIRLGKLLAVQKLLLGSYQVVDGSLRVTARLVDTETGMVDPQSSLAAEDRVENIFDVYEQLARKLLASFQVRVSAGQSGRLQAFKQSGTRSLKAYESYLKGMDYYAAGDEQSLKEARSHFKKALGHDKKFTAARQALANTYFRMNELDDAIDEYEKIVKKGVDVDDRLYNTLGLFYRAAGKSSKARESFRAAISLNPSSA
jgi:adenylate cyclase